MSQLILDNFQLQIGQVRMIVKDSGQAVQSIEILLGDQTKAEMMVDEKLNVMNLVIRDTVLADIPHLQCAVDKITLRNFISGLTKLYNSLNEVPLYFIHHTYRPVLNLFVTDSYKFLPAALMDWIMLKPSQNRSTPSWLRKHITWAAFRLNFLAHLSARLLSGSTAGLCKKSVYLSFSSAIRLYRLYPSLKYSLGGSYSYSDFAVAMISSYLWSNSPTVSGTSSPPSCISFQ